MKVLITGGAGYIGNELVYQLSQRDEISKIIVYDNLSRKNYNLFLDTQVAPEKVEFWNCEILDTRKLKQAVKNSDIVYHLAAKVSTPLSSEDSHLYEQINNWGTAEVVYAAEESDVKKFVYLSSVSVYGAQDDEISIETHPNPKTFYGTSKLRGESHVLRLLEKMQTYIFRCGNVYGYSPSMRFDAVINRFMFEANYLGRITIQGNGLQNRAFIHVDKVVNVLTNLLFSDFPKGVYNLTDTSRSILDVAETIKEIYPSLEMLFIDQHLWKRQLKVVHDHRIDALISHKENPFMEQLIQFKKRFSFGKP